MNKIKLYNKRCHIVSKQLLQFVVKNFRIIYEI